MGRILKDIYQDAFLAPVLGFKGGSCAYLIYDFPRFSVDLDFDLFKPDSETQETVFEKIGLILSKYGSIKNKYIKRDTVFFLLSYGEADRNIKVEVSTRSLSQETNKLYELKEYLGIPMEVAKKDYLFAGKLAALISRSETAARDIYDIYYFAKNNWEINSKVIAITTGKNLSDYLTDCIEKIEGVKENQILKDLGELLEEKEKIWVKKSLKAEAIFMLKNYQATTIKNSVNQR